MVMCTCVRGSTPARLAMVLVLLSIEKINAFWVPALRVIRAGTRLTVHRSLPYQNSIELGQSGAAHADAHDHEKLILEYNNIDKWSC